MLRRMSALALLQLLILGCVAAAQTSPSANDWKAVEQAIGRSGQGQADGAYKVSFPRGDLKVTVGDVELKPALALGGWVAFSKPGAGAMVMGDLVLTEDEVTSAISSLQDKGIEITAVHNHVLHANPATYFPVSIFVVVSRVSVRIQCSAFERLDDRLFLNRNSCFRQAIGGSSR